MSHENNDMFNFSAKCFLCFIAFNFCLSCTRGDVECFSGNMKVYSQNNVRYITSDSKVLVFEEGGDRVELSKFSCKTIRHNKNFIEML